MHSEACRKRILHELGKGDPRVVASEENIQEFLAKSIKENAKNHRCRRRMGVGCEANR